MHNYPRDPLVLAIALSGLFLILSVAHADESGVSIDQLEDLVLANDPGIASLNHQIDSLVSQSNASDSLPDPQLRAGLMNVPLEHGGFTTEGMTQSVIGIRQNIPPRGHRTAMSQKYTNLANAKSQELDSHRRELRFAARESWLKAYYSERAIDLVKESRSFVVDLLDSTRSLYSVGTINQTDVLFAELELLRIDDRILALQGNKKVAYANLQRLLGNPLRIHLKSELPDWELTLTLDELREKLQSNPKLATNAALSDAADSEIAVQQSMAKPNWAIDVQWGLRDGTLPNQTARSDLGSVALMFNVPLWGNKRNNHEIASAKSQLEVTKLQRTEIARQLLSDLQVAFTKWQSASERLQHYSNNITAQINLQSDASLIAYQNKVLGISDVLNSHLRLVETQLEVERLQVDRLIAWAEIDRLTGLSN